MNFNQPKAAAGVSKDTPMMDALIKTFEDAYQASMSEHQGTEPRLAREAGLRAIAPQIERAPTESSSDQCVAREAEAALRDIISWKEDTLGARPKVSGPYDCQPEITEAFDRGARMAFYRCALRASEALANPARAELK